MNIIETKETEVYFRKSKRIELRPVFESDVPLLVKWINDPEVTQFLASYLPMMEEDEREWVKSLRNRRDRNVVFMMVVDGKPIGTMGIHNIDFRQGTAVTGAMIGEKEYWGKGYGTEAKMLVLEYAFHTLNLRKICSNVIAFNDRSVKYSHKCGYIEEGRRKAQFYARGKYWDEVWLAVFRPDWEPLWEQFESEQKDFLRI